MGKMAEARQLAEASVTVMRRIDQQWGVGRALIGLGDLARLQGRPGEAHSRYVEALAIFRQVGARPQMARCLAGLGRVAMDLDAPEQARLHLTHSIQLSQDTGARQSVSRGLEVFAALAVQEGLPERAVRLAAAATALRQTAGLPPIPDARTDSYLASARHLGDAAVGRLWARGLAMSSEAAVALALQPARRAVPADSVPVLAVVRASETAGQRSSPPPPDQSSAPP